MVGKTSYIQSSKLVYLVTPPNVTRDANNDIQGKIKSFVTSIILLLMKFLPFIKSIRVTAEKASTAYGGRSGNSTF